MVCWWERSVYSASYQSSVPQKKEGYDHMKGKAIMYAPLEKNPEDTIVYSRITPFGAHSFFDSTTTLPCMFGGCAWQVS